jgi:signal transduction histidine kinase
MKLLNYTTCYFAGILLLAITVWAALFYYNMLDEIYDSMDDGLENQKMLVIRKAARDSTVLNQRNFEEGYYAIKEVAWAQARNQKDVYRDTLMYMLNEKDFEPVRMLKTAFRQDNKYYEMRVITSMVEEDDLREDLLYALLWLYVGLITSILALNNVLLKRIWQPFYFLLQRLQQFRLEDSRPFDPVRTHIDEFRLLNTTVEKLLQSNINSYVSQKNFIENASHELQTPLAISLNKLELLAESNHLSPDQMAQIEGVMHHLERMKRLNKSLLLLSKIENNQFEAVEEVNINELLKKILNDFSDQAAFRQIETDYQEKGACRQKVNADLATIMLTNLVKNAILHNQPGGAVRVVLRKESLSIENTGQQKPLNQQKLFTRFYKDSASPGSTGLGLAIVKAIADSYSFRITYEYRQKHLWTLHFKFPF